MYMNDVSKACLSLCVAAICSLAGMEALAVPAIPTPVTMTMPDGTELRVRIHGDEKFHYYSLEEGGRLLVADASGHLCYARARDNRLVSTGIKAHSAEARTAAEAEFLQFSEPLTSLPEGVTGEPMGRTLRAKSQFTDLFTAYPSMGSPRSLILLVQFPDCKFITPDPLNAFTRMMTEPGYSYNGATGSASDYFAQNSRGLFTPQFDVYGPVTLPNSMAYYGRETANLHDINPYEMVADACRLLDDVVDFSKYDEDGDGEVDNVFLFYAGYGQNSGASPETIWPHAANIWTYGGIKLVLDGKQVGNYACTNEINGTSGTQLSGIGTFCHEFSHVLGLPDLYPTDGSGAFTPGYFELMDRGPYLNDGNTPPYMSVYDRMCLQWINPRELTEGETVVLKSFEDVLSDADNEALMVTTISDNEYYLLENRQRRGWDTYIPGHGMLVWHIDFDRQIWKNNWVNSPSRSQHLRADIVEADGVATTATASGDPFPGTSNVTSFTDNTTPSMRTWTNIRVEKPITNIREQDGVISFDIMGGGERIAPVEALAADAVTPVSFRVRWQGRSEVFNYEIDLFRGEEKVPLNTFTHTTQSLADCHLTVDGLTPSTAYSYVVRAVSGERRSANSDRIRITTAAPTFDMLQVTGLKSSAVSGNAFTLGWQPMADATGYLLNVYTKRYNDPATDVCDFTGGLTEIPDGWYTNSSVVSSMAGTFGTARPSLRLAANSALLRTRVYGVNINGISFWTKAAAASSGRLLITGQTASGQWLDIATVAVDTLVDGARTLRFDESTSQTLAAGCRSIQISFERESGSVFIDDVVVAYNGAISRQWVNGIEAFPVGAVESHTVDNLLPSTHYFCTVQAVSPDGLTSLPSDELEVVTLAGSSLSVIESGAGISVTASGRSALIANGGSAAVDYAVTNASGFIVARGRAGAGCTVHTPTLAPGVYLLTAGPHTVKITI